MRLKRILVITAMTLFLAVITVAIGGDENDKVAVAQPTRALPAFEQQPNAKLVEDNQLVTVNDVVIASDNDAKELRMAGIGTFDVRYLSMHNFTAAQRKAVWEVTSFVVNSLSKERVIVPPTIIDCAGGAVMRLQLGLYGIDPAAWDKMAEQGSGPAAARLGDPYFHITVKETVQKFNEEKYMDTEKETTVSGGRTYYTGATKQVEKVRRVAAGTETVEKLIHAPWMPAQEVVDLSLLTNSSFPILRADWFIYISTIPPAYYDLLGLGKKEEDFEKAALLNKKDAEKARSVLRGNVAFSTVVHHNRALERFPTVQGTVRGYVWVSLDFLKSFDASDVFANPIDLKPDAKEWIASLPNSLQFYFVTDANGNRIDFADPQVAIDNETPLRDKLVYTGRNCMYCHSEGLRPIRDRIRELSKGNIAFLVPTIRDETGKIVPNDKVAKDIRDLFFSADLAPIIKYDQSSFAAAVKTATGCTPTVNASQFIKIIADYVDAPITVEMAAAEAGVDTEGLLRVLRNAINIDHTLTVFLAEPKLESRRDQWERRGFAQMMLLLQKDGEIEEDVGEDK